MNRRNVLLGLGTAAAGSGIVFGSGAFTQVQASRDVTIRIGEDTDALLALNANDSVASVDNDDDTGELFINTDQITNDDGNEGFNSGAQIQIGETTESFGDTVVQGEGAFSITNNFDNVPEDGSENDEIDIGINLSDLTTPKSDLEFVVTVYDTDDEQDRDFRISPSDGREVITDVASSEELHVAIFLDTATVSNPEDFDGEVVISAGPSLGGDKGFPTDDELVNAGQVLNVNSGATFDSGDTDTPIQDAVDDAGSFDTLRVGANAESESYEESVTIDVEGLTLEGAGASATTIDAENSSSAVLIEADEVTVQGFHVEGFTELGISDSSDYMDNTVYIKDNEVTGPNSQDVGSATVQGIQISGGDGSEVIDNTVEMIPEFVGDEWSSTGILPEGTDNAEIRGNTVDVSDIGIGISTYNDEAKSNVIQGNSILGSTCVEISATQEDVKGTDIVDNTIKNSQEGLNIIEYGYLEGFEGGEITDTDVSDNDFMDNDVHVDDPDDFVDLNAILNDQANTFDPNGEVSENQIVPGEQ